MISQSEISIIAAVFCPDIVAHVIGALILPHMAHAFVGGLGMIAATGAASLGFGAAFCIGYLIVENIVLALLPEEQKDKLVDFSKNNPILSSIPEILIMTGLNMTGIYLACLLMGQAFLPFLICTTLGSLVISAGLTLAPPLPTFTHLATPYA